MGHATARRATQARRPLPLRTEAQPFVDPTLGSVPAPVRSELFGAERLQQHAHRLAAGQAVERRRGRRRPRTPPFFPRLEQNLQMLQRVQRYLQALQSLGRALSPAAQLLLAHLPLIEAQAAHIHQGLPAHFYAELPKLRTAPLAGLPRVYGLAWAFVSHTDASFDAPLLATFVRAYQDDTPLTLGELSALPATLRVVLTENLARLAELVATVKAARELADWCCDHEDELDEAQLDHWLDLLQRRGVKGAFLAQMSERLRAADAPPSRWLTWLTAHAPDADAQRSAAQAARAANNVSVTHTLAALQAIDLCDWPALIDGMSPVLQCLRRHPGFVADSADTRDRCTRAVARIARAARRDEIDVAQQALARSQAADAPAQAREAGPAYWLIGPGRDAFETGFELRRSRWRLPASWRWLLYAGSALAGTLLLMQWALAGPPLWPWAEFISVLLLALPASECALALVDRLVRDLVPVPALPRRELAQGLDAAQRTLVVVPCVLTSSQVIVALVQRLEQHHLASRLAEVQYALLSDWADARQPHAASDALLLDAARDAIADLNQRHPAAPGGPPRFLLLHRERSWSECERAWIGWERQRGKLEQLTEHLADAAPFPFMDLGDESWLAPHIRFLLTLEGDAVLPPGALVRLLGIAAHPLNAAQVDPDTRRVVRGHALYQPRRVAPMPRDAERTLFRWLHRGLPRAGEDGDATQAVSQGLFGDGVFNGQGLLDVQAVHAVLGGRVPEAALLAPGIYEGLWARCAWVDDVTWLQPDAAGAEPAWADAHRDARADWQLVPFVRGVAQAQFGAPGLWKLLDRLRRSLLAPMAVALLWWACATQAIAPWRALPLVLGMLALGPLLDTLAAAVPRRRDAALGHFARSTLREIGRHLLAAAWRSATLLDLALVQVDAIGRTLWRLYRSRRHLLQWTSPAFVAPAAQAASPAATPVGAAATAHTHTDATTELGTLAQQHWPTMAVALLAAAVGLTEPTVAAPWLLGIAVVWLLTPLWLWLAARPLPPARTALGPEDRAALHHMARDSWRLFERAIDAEHHHLPPHHLQVQPQPTLARHTSPTDIGLYLLAAATAHRLGFIGTDELIDRLDNTLSTLERLPRTRGHFAARIDTATLQPLPPARVSTAASGDLAASLWAVAQACREFAAHPAPHVAMEQALHAAMRRVKHASDPALREVLAERPLQALLSGDLWALWRRAPQQLRQTLDAAQARWREHTREGERREWQPVADLLHQLRSLLRDREADRDGWTARLRALAERADTLAAAMDFSVLYDPARAQFHPGYRIDDAALEAGRHALLASPALLASFVAIAKGDVPLAHWHRLARPYAAPIARLQAPPLGSATGGLADYLMPALLLDEPPGSVLDQGAREAVHAHKAHGERQGRPWGASASACFELDADQAYRVAPFGLPALAWQASRETDAVIAPYASALAAQVGPATALANLRRLERLGARSVYGFIDALDFTPARLGDDGRPRRVETFLAGHQAMTLVALANVLQHDVARRWFGASALARAHDALLHEPVPHEIVCAAPPGAPHGVLQSTSALAGDPGAPQAEAADAALAPGIPGTQWLGNGRYQLSLRANGAGHSRWRGLAINRDRDDALRDRDGTWLMMRQSGEVTFHSLTRAPLAHPAARYATRFFPERVEFDALTDTWEATTTAWVSADDDVEFRQVTLHNLGDREAEFELLSCFEPLLAATAFDAATGVPSVALIRAYQVDPGCLLLERRGTADAGPVSLAHFVASTDCDAKAMRITCDRSRLMPRLGSGAQLRPAAALPPLANGELVTGLDPVASIAVRCKVAAKGRYTLTFATAVAIDATAVHALVDKYRQDVHLQRTRLMAATLAGIRDRELGLQPDDLPALQALCTLLLGSPAPRPGAAHAAGALAVPWDRRALWRFGIAGDRPLLLVRLPGLQGWPMVRTLLAAHRRWQLDGLDCDLALLAGDMLEAPAVQQQVDALRAGLGVPAAADGVHVLGERQLAPAERTALESLARVDLRADDTLLAQALARALRGDAPSSAALAAAAQGHAGPDHEREEALVEAAATAEELAPCGFTADGQAFEITIDSLRATPRAWGNVLANPGFGFVVTEAGGGYTWARNSRTQQLTPASHDALLDPPAEHFLMQDLATRDTWGLLPTLDRNGLQGYRVTHLQGETRFEHDRHGLQVRVSVAVHPQEPAKVLHVQLHNAGKPRALRAVGLVEWLLGEHRADRFTLATEFVPEVSAVFAQQLEHSRGFGGGTAFLMLVGVPPQQWTCARSEFFDSNGRLHLPRAFAGATGVGLDPCGALEAPLLLRAGATVELSWVIGWGDTREAALALAARLREGEAAQVATQARAAWDARLSTLAVNTPDPLFDALVNRWLPYQVVGAGLWAHARFDHAAGATPFREQLQHAMALAVTDPATLRAQLVTLASHQFAEGDVQHSRDEPHGSGWRTRCSDDLLWLPLALQHYLDVTADASVLDEQAPFLDGPPVPADAPALRDMPGVGASPASLYEHGARAIDRALRFGAHGLPLVRGGDWQPTLDGVGAAGQGESVWLGWLLLIVLRTWTPLARTRGEHPRALVWGSAQRELEQTLAKHGWDGQWWRRAYLDNGSPLGSHLNSECKIEASTQAWALFALQPDHARARQGLTAAHAKLVDTRHGVVRLLDPPVQSASGVLGAIEALPPGVGDNGGQLAVATAWAAMAQAQAGQAAQAWELFTLASPAHRSRQAGAQRRYGLEPYAVGDTVCTQPPHLGRGLSAGAGSGAAWLWRAAVESLLGLRLRGDRLCFSPCLPPDWGHARVALRLGGQRVRVLLQVWRPGAEGDPGDVPDQAMDGAFTVDVDAGEWIELSRLGPDDTVRVRVGPAALPDASHTEQAMQA